MKLKDWLVPREEKFFEILQEQADLVVQGAEAFAQMLDGYAVAVQQPDGVRTLKRRVKEIEHQGDLKTHELYQALNATFITPLDREDIAGLAASLDDILDYTWATANHLHLYEVKHIPKELVEVGYILRDQTHLLRDVLQVLPEPSKRAGIAAKLVEIHSLENQADELTNRAKAELFHQDDVKHILKMKDVLEYIETATDKCEDAADVIRDILVKHA